MELCLKEAGRSRIQSRSVSLNLAYLKQTLSKGLCHEDKVNSLLESLSLLRFPSREGEWGGGGTPYDRLYYGKAPPTRKGCPFFQASGIWKSRDFTSWCIKKDREICHLGLWKGPKGLTDEFYGFINSRRHSIVVDWFLLKRQCIYSSYKGCKVLNKVCERNIICQQKINTKGKTVWVQRSTQHVNITDWFVLKIHISG